MDIPLFLAAENNSPPPPTQEEMQKMSIPEMVNRPGPFIQLHKSKAWLQAFRFHPEIIKLDEVLVPSEQYALKLSKLCESEFDSATGRRISDAFQAHMKERGFDSNYQDKVMKHFRKYRKKYNDQERLKKRKTKSDLEEEQFEKGKQIYLNTLDRMREESNNFIQHLKLAGIHNYEQLTPKQVEQESRMVYLYYRNKDQKRADDDMSSYLRMRNCNRNEIRLAKAARTKYNKYHYAHPTTSNPPPILFGGQLSPFKDQMVQHHLQPIYPGLLSGGGMEFSSRLAGSKSGAGHGYQSETTQNGKDSYAHIPPDNHHHHAPLPEYYHPVPPSPLHQASSSSFHSNPELQDEELAWQELVDMHREVHHP